MYWASSRAGGSLVDLQASGSLLAVDPPHSHLGCCPRQRPPGREGPAPPPRLLRWPGHPSFAYPYCAQGPDCGREGRMVNFTDAKEPL